MVPVLLWTHPRQDLVRLLELNDIVGQVSDWLRGLDDAIYPYAHFFVNNDVTGTQTIRYGGKFAISTLKIHEINFCIVKNKPRTFDILCVNLGGRVIAKNCISTII